MPQYNRAELGRMATESGFVRDTFEKVLRLSVDIDMDYTPNDTREDMLECREKITNVIKNTWSLKGICYQMHRDLAIAWMHFTTIIRTPVVIGI